MHCYKVKYVSGIDFVYSTAIFAEVLCESKIQHYGLYDE